MFKIVKKYTPNMVLTLRGWIKTAYNKTLGDEPLIKKTIKVQELQEVSDDDLIEEQNGILRMGTGPGDEVFDEEIGKIVPEEGYNNIYLLGVGDKKVNVIKTVRSVTGLGLKEAKVIVDDVYSGCDRVLLIEGASDCTADMAVVAFGQCGACIAVES